MAQLSVLEFADKLNEIIPIVIKEFAKRQANELYKGKITLPQFLILQLLHKEVELKMSRLARFVNVTTAAMTGLVERMVMDKYVVRVNDPKDRRVIRVKLTVKGSDLVKKINEQRRQMIVKTFGQVSENEREAYLKVLVRVKDILSREEGIIK
ncbi:MAG: MarR family transcriptional regulator [Candidatus Omnitrophica bacterium]|nr:MarR family transcriptional regulator [Candidatus Omnitrophota bacterium]